MRLGIDLVVSVRQAGTAGVALSGLKGSACRSMALAVKLSRWPSPLRFSWRLCSSSIAALRFLDIAGLIIRLYSGIPAVSRSSQLVLDVVGQHLIVLAVNGQVAIGTVDHDLVSGLGGPIQ